MNTINRRNLFALAAIAGVIATWYFNILFFMDIQSFSLIAFIEANYENHASASISNDLLVVIFTFIVWSYTEAKRLGMKNWWVYVVLTPCIAAAFSFPLFMFMRERAIEKAAASE
jgi:hypothetical protein